MEENNKEWPTTMSPSKAAEYVEHLLGDSVSSNTVRLWCLRYGIGHKQPPVPNGRWKIFKKKLDVFLSPMVEQVEKNKNQTVEEIAEELHEEGAGT